MNPTITANSQPASRSITSFVMERGSRWPWLTLGLAVATLIAAWWPALTEWCTLQRASYGRGAWWELFTGHFAHWSAEHLFWDLAVFTTLGFACERLDRRAMIATLFVSALTISAGVLILCPQFHSYRGLSGIDSALLAVYLTLMWRHGRLGLIAKGLTILTGVGLMAKIAWEVVTGAAIFVQSENMTPVPEAHAIGAAVGLLIGLFVRARRPDQATAI